VLLQDGAPVVFEDARNDTAYCQHLAKEWLDFDGKPMPKSVAEEVAASVRPKLRWDGKRVVFPKGSDPKGGYWLELPERASELIGYGKPKRMDKVTLKDVLAYPIWLGMLDDEKYGEDYERPVTSQSDVDTVVLGLVDTPFIAITFKVHGCDTYGTGYYDHNRKSLSSISIWQGKRWVPLESAAGLKPPLVFVSVPTILGRKNVRFQCGDLKSGRAKMVKG
jgi:hypothetical protein